jgi:GntR family transcriptional regulator
MTIHLNTASGQPLYEQIVAQIRLQVLTGALHDGDQLPSIRALARELQVSIITTKRAYEELEREGILAVSAGRGSFVRADSIATSRKTQLDQLTASLSEAAGQAKVLGLGGEQFAELARETYTKASSLRT